MNRPIAIAACLALAACSQAHPSTGSGTTGGGTRGSLPPTTVGELSARTNIPWIAIPTDDNPELLYPTLPPQPSFTPTGDSTQDSATATAAAMAFLAQYGAIWEMTQPGAELTAAGYRASPDGIALDLDQWSQGVPVFGCGVTLAFDLTGSIAVVSANYVPGLGSVQVTPTVTPAAAAQAAQAQYLSTEGSAGSSTSTPLLGIEVWGETTGLAPTLVYQVDVDDNRYLIDAQAGTVVASAVLFENLSGTGNGLRGTSESFPVLPLGAAAPAVPSVPFITAIESGQGYTTAAPPIPSGSYLMGQAPNVTAPYGTGKTLPPIQYWDVTVNPAQPIFAAGLSNDWDTQGLFAGAAVDAANHMSVVSQVFQKNHGWQSYDNDGGTIVTISKVSDAFLVDHGGQNCNAGWSEDQHFMAFFDCLAALTAPIPGLVNANWYSAGTALDVVGHEFGHAITSYSSHLQRCSVNNDPDSCEYGTMNEAMSDVLGNMVEHSVTPDPSSCGTAAVPCRNFEIGEDMMKPTGSQSGKALRNFVHPAQSTEPQTHPAHMVDYCTTCDEHGNTTIPTGAFYMMNHGGTNDTSKVTVDGGLGWTNAEKIWWQTETHCMRSRATFKNVADCNVLWANRDAQSMGVAPATLIQPIVCAWWAVGLNMVDGGIVSPDAGNAPHYVAGNYNVCCGDQSDGGCDGGCIANQNTCTDGGWACCNATDSCNPSTVDGGDGGLVCCVPDGNPDPSDGGTGAQCCSEQDDGNGH